jgi:hypothetical protein
MGFDLLLPCYRKEIAPPLKTDLGRFSFDFSSMEKIFSIDTI